MNFWFILTKFSVPILCRKSKHNKYYVFTSKPVVIEYDEDCENVLLSKDNTGNITYSLYDPEMDTWLEKETIPVDDNVVYQDYTHFNDQIGNNRAVNATPVLSRGQIPQNPINQDNLNQNSWEVVGVADGTTSAEIMGPDQANVIDPAAKGESGKDAAGEKGKDSKDDKKKSKDSSKSKDKKKKKSGKKEKDDGIRDCIGITSLVTVLMCVILI